MTFTRPSLLWLLVLVVALAGLYVVLQRRRRHYAVRFTNIDLLASVAPKRPGWRRHVVAGAVGLALVASVLGLAQPTHAVDVARDRAVVVLAIDVSASMAATDVDPNRLQSAIDAASAFVEDLPDGFQVGLVAFDSTARLVAAPTTNHDAVIAAVRALQLGKGTAAGDGIITALDAIRSAQAAMAESVRSETGDAAAAPSATIVLLSDGDTTVGTPVDQAAQQAASDGVPVSTITYGTAQGVIRLNGELVQVPPDPESMAEVASTTGGSAFDAQSTSELESVYAEIQGRVGHEQEQRSLIVWFLGAALLLMVLASVGSMIWTGRFL